MHTTERGHPYIPNSAPAVKAAMLAEIGVGSISEIYAEIPDDLRIGRRLNLPEALASESELTRHLRQLLGRNQSTASALSFLGAGCYDHHVPSICSEINSRAEFLTAYAGEPYEDHGKWQALFEYTSLMAELLDMDVVNVPTYDGYQAAATALRMAGRITGRSTVLVSSMIAPAKRAKILAYLDGALTVVDLPAGGPDQPSHPDLDRLLDPSVAAVYLETPNYIGVLEADGRQIADTAHDAGALLVVGTDPICLGYADPPAAWGADIVCGDIQSLGLGLHYGGANGGFIATPDDERFVFEYPSRLFGLAPTAVPGEIGFADIAYERTSLANRENGNEWVGTAAALWGITAGVYLALMGPAGMSRLGQGIAARTRYAIESLQAIPGITVPYAGSPHWREFLITVDETLSIPDIAAGLRGAAIFAPVDVTGEISGFGSAGLVSVTERHSKRDIDELASALRKVLA